MAEYIEKEYAVDAVLDVYYDTPDIDLSGEKFEAAIRKIQAADVSPVRHGRWVNEQMIVGGFAETWACDCSVCGRTQREPLWKPNYCPNCGAKMDLEEDDHELRRDL